MFSSLFFKSMFSQIVLYVHVWKKKKEDILLNYRYKYLFQHCSNFLPFIKSSCLLFC